MTIITAINPTHQSIVNRFLSWNAKYDQIVSATDDNGGRKQERAFDKALELWVQLPKREQQNISRHGISF